MPLIDTGDDVNENSIVARLTYARSGELFTALFMGDAGMARESELVENHIRSTSSISLRYGLTRALIRDAWAMPGTSKGGNLRRPSSNRPAAQRSPGLSRSQAARLFGISSRSIPRSRTVERQEFPKRRCSKCSRMSEWGRTDRAICYRTPTCPCPRSRGASASTMAHATSIFSRRARAARRTRSAVVRAGERPRRQNEPRRKEATTSGMTALAQAHEPKTVSRPMPRLAPVTSVTRRCSYRALEAATSVTICSTVGSITSG